MSNGLAKLIKKWEFAPVLRCYYVRCLTTVGVSFSEACLLLIIRTTSPKNLLHTNRYVKLPMSNCTNVNLLSVIYFTSYVSSHKLSSL